MSEQEMSRMTLTQALGCFLFKFEMQQELILVYMFRYRRNPILRPSSTWWHKTPSQLISVGLSFRVV
jgi:hypothetical protein